jgi:AAA+ superfamily predicted ATPase
MNLEALKLALEASPDNIPLLLMVAKLHEDQFELLEARNCLDRVIKLQPDHPEALLGIARLIDMAGETSEAVVRLDALCAMKPDFAAAWLLRSRIALDEKEAQAARAYYDKAVALDRSVADDELLAAILKAGGGKRSAMTANGPIEIDDDDDNDDDDPLFTGMDAVTARELDLEFRVKADIRFEDVGGMDKVKEDIRMKIIHPLKNPELFAAYGKKPGGGVLLYGPPGCGKTLLARATAGEINASFFSIGLHHVLDMYIGESEQKLHKIFELARKAAPSVLFFDEIDALAADRRDMRQSAGRGIINQFLDELDGSRSQNDGVLILGATNAPWHVDGAFMRPGRFDRLVFVPPPDGPAREEIARIHARGKPLVDFDPAQIAKKSEGFSGADLKAVFDLATEAALTEAMKKGALVPVSGKMLLNACKEVKPSTRKWFESAKNYALYANQSGFYDDVLIYLGLKK